MFTHCGHRCKRSPDKIVPYVKHVTNVKNVTQKIFLKTESPARGLLSSPPACTASLIVGSLKAP